MLKAEEKSSSRAAAQTATTAKPKKAAKAETGAKPAKAVSVKSATKATASKPKKAKGLDAGLRHQLINETAHFLAEKRCCGASEMDDWLFAERLVDGVSKAVQ